MQLMAAGVGIGSCATVVNRRPTAAEILGLPEKEFCPYLLTLGHPARQPKLPKPLDRKLIEEAIRWIDGS